MVRVIPELEHCFRLGRVFVSEIIVNPGRTFENVAFDKTLL